MSELKTLRKCPFCGGEAEVEKSGSGVFDTWYVTCLSCCASVWENTEAEAVEAWNTRYERKGKNLRGNDDETLCSECGTLVVDMAYFDKLGGGMVMVRNYPDYCPKCGVRLE